jgi:hypothetical protein
MESSSVMRSFLLLHLLLLPLCLQATGSNSYCPFGTSTGCHCEDYDGGHDLWCPSRFAHDYRFNYKGGVLWITCNPDNDHLTGEDLINRVKGIKLPYVHSLKLEHCPVLTRSYSNLVNEVIDDEAASGLKKLYVEYNRYDEFDLGNIIDDQFAGLDQLEQLDIRDAINNLL